MNKIHKMYCLFVTETDAIHLSRLDPNQEAMLITSVNIEFYCSGNIMAGPKQAGAEPNTTQNCNLIPSAHRTEQVVLSSQNDHWTGSQCTVFAARCGFQYDSAPKPAL